MRVALSVGQLFFSFNGRIARGTFWWAALAVWAVLVFAVPVVDRVSPRLGVPVLDLVVLA